MGPPGKDGGIDPNAEQEILNRIVTLEEALEVIMEHNRILLEMLESYVQR